MRLPSAPFKAAASASASICPRATRPVLRWSSHDAGRSAGRFIFHQALQRSAGGKGPFDLRQQRAADMFALPVGVDKQMVKEIIGGPYGGKAHRLAVAFRDPQLFIRGGGIEILQPPRRGGKPVHDKLRARRKIWRSAGESAGSPGRTWRLRGSAMIEDLAIVHFEDFAFGIGDQHVVTAHIGPVAAGVRRRQVTLLPLFDVVFRGGTSPERCRRCETG